MFKIYTGRNLPICWYNYRDLVYSDSVHNIRVFPLNREFQLSLLLWPQVIPSRKFVVHRASQFLPFEFETSVSFGLRRTNSEPYLASFSLLPVEHVEQEAQLARQAKLFVAQMREQPTAQRLQEVQHLHSSIRDENNLFRSVLTELNSTICFTRATNPIRKQKSFNKLSKTILRSSLILFFVRTPPLAWPAQRKSPD